MLDHYHTPLLPYPGNEFDFWRADGKRIEVKSDYYSLQNTEFFFMERWSNIDKERPGGPWQSLGKSDTFVYLFIRDGVYFEFDDLPALVARLEDLTFNLPLIKIRNKGHTGGGYKVPLEALSDLYVDYRLYWSVDEEG